MMFRKPADLKYDRVITLRKAVASGVLSGFIDTLDFRWAAVIIARGPGGAAASRFKMTFAESDTASAGTFASMTAISGYGMSGFGNLASGTASCQVGCVSFACGNGVRKRFIGVKLSMTAGSSAVLDVHGLLFGNTFPPLTAAAGNSESGFFVHQAN